MASVGKYVEVDGRRLYQLRRGGIAKGKVDSYKIVGCRGSGGFGAIYTVRRRSDNLLAVLKMSTDVGKNMSGGERIRREAWVMRKCGRLNPDLIPQVLDEGEIRGRPFFVLENLQPLAWAMKKDDEEGLPDTPEGRMLFFKWLIESVKAVHEAGFVHCDIKPQNIMERPNAKHRPILIDFGSAHPIENELTCAWTKPTGWADLTRKSGQVAFTPGYDSPEDAFTIQKDIFAIGQVIRDSFKESHVDPAWMGIIGRCISRSTKFRYRSLDELEKDIENIEKRYQKQYWKMRKEKIVEQRRVERSLAKAEEMEVEWERILYKDEKLSDEGLTVFRVNFPADARFHYVVHEPLPLNENSILMISGKGILEADVSGPASSVVVLRGYATFHNVSAELPPANDLTYVIVGPGSYLNFPNLHSSQYNAFFPGRRRRILRDIDSTTSFRFGGPRTFSGVEEETLDAIDGSNMPPSYKTVLRDFFSGKGFTVEPRKMPKQSS